MVQGRHIDFSEPVQLLVEGNDQRNFFRALLDHSPGMLETLICRSFAASGLDSCIDSFFECIQAELGYGPHRPEKARAHAYIATRRDPHVSVGVAAQRSYWDLDHAVFDGVGSFLRSL